MDTNEKLLEKIKTAHSAYTSKENTDEHNESFINNSLHQMGYYTIASYFPEINSIADPLIKLYSDEIVLSFANFYAKNKISLIKEELIDRDTFIEKWTLFIHDFLQCPLDIGEKTNALREFYLKNKPAVKYDPNFKNKANRFWTYYVSRKQKNNDYRITPDLPCSGKIHPAELPFYLILYTIYYISNVTIAREEPFDSFAGLFHKYQKYGNINTIISWCIQCYYEWFIYYKDHPSPNTTFNNLCYYISGLPTFLEHFGYYWHRGIQWHKHDFIDLLNNYDYNLYEDDTDTYINFILWIVNTHRNYTQSTITDKEIYNSPNQKGEQDLSTVTSYIQYHLEGFFQCPKDELRKHFKDDISFLTVERTEELTEDSKKALITVKMKEFFASIFLNLAHAENEFLYYINLHMYFYFFINEFMNLEVNDTPNLDIPISNFENWYFSFVHSFKSLDSENIYKNISSLFSELLEHFPLPNSEWEYRLYKLYLESF
ncbi:MAG: hypothetical protein IJZ44_02230 [Lachnospiraceae bacterium]|nr:hypothetical protein [Lachnospiraceae bacterium]